MLQLQLKSRNIFSLFIRIIDDFIQLCGVKLKTWRWKSPI